MLSHTLRFPVAVALVATVVAVGVVVLALLALDQSQAGTSQAVAHGAMAVDCDASQSGIQTACTYAPGSSFNIEIHITQAPAGGYNKTQHRRSLI